MNLHLFYQGPFYNRIDKGLAFAYVASGAITTMSDYAAFAVCYSLLGTDLFTATAIAYVIGLVVSYLQNRFWVYRKTASQQTETTNLWRYAVFLLVNLGITYLILEVLQTVFGVTPFIGKFVVGFFMFFWIYLGNTYFVFRGPKIGPIKL